MKIIIFNGSPRTKNSNTHFIVKEFIKGAESEGAEVENIFLFPKKINTCLACFDCWRKTPGKCIVKDDTEELLEKFINSDVAVFATPLYVDNISGIMKNFMDRMLPLFHPIIEKDENGESRHKKRFDKYPKIVVISNSGFPEQSHFQVLRLLFRRIARNTHSEVIGEIYRGGGEILQVKNLVLKPLINKYKKLVREAGREIVKNMRISEELQKKLEKPIIPISFYISGANKSWTQQ